MSKPFPTLDPARLAIDPDLSRASTLPAEWYVSPEALALEQDRIFARTWQLVGERAKVERPGDFFTCEVAGEPILVVRAQDGALKAFFNVCRHRGGPVATGDGNVKIFKCAYHGWLYGTDGKLRTTPEFDGVQCFDKADYGLRPVAVDTWGPFVFVNVAGADGDGPSLLDVLGKIPAETGRFPLVEMKFFKRVVYEIDCNWKVYVDNYLEGYHIPQVHPGLMREIDYPAYRAECERWYSKQHAPIRAKKGSVYEKSIAAGADAQALYYWVFPNLMLNFYPDNLQTNVILPLGHERTATVFDWYVVDGDRPEAAAELERSLAFSETVQSEDILICQTVQKGLRSRSYRTGRFSVQREAGVHHFHGLLAELLRKEPKT